MAVIKQEWKWHLKLLRGWLIATVLTIAVFMSFFPSFNEGMDDLIAMLHSFPVEFLRGFGLDIESFGTYSGFLAYIYTFIQLLLGIVAVQSGMMLMGREKLNKTSDFLFSKPISRSSLWAQKNTAGLLGILVINAIIAVTVYGIAKAQGMTFEPAIRDILLSSVIVQLIFFFLGGLLANMKPRLRTVTGPAGAIGLGFYFLLVISRLLEEDALSKLSIYGLFDTMQVQQKGIDPLNLTIAFILCALLAVISYRHYTRMDVEI